jgi:zinc protease
MEFEQIRKSEITGSEFGRTEPQVLAFNRLRRAIYPFPKGDVRGTLSVDEQVEALKAAKLEDARAFYKGFWPSHHRHRPLRQNTAGGL